jgi:predicted DNA-binding transcriptional regulator AlpA
MNPYAIDREVAAAVDRVLRLPEEAQCRVLDAISVALRSSLCELPLAVDDEVAERAEALTAIRRAAALLEKNDGIWPTSKEFDGLAGELGGWTSRRVTRAWGRWKFAIDALDGGRVRLTPAQHAAASKAAGRRGSFDAPIPCVRRWLEAKPLDQAKGSYVEWSRRYNAAAGDGDLLMLSPRSINDILGIPWRETVRVAADVISLANARRSETDKRTTWTSGPHQFVGSTEICTILGRPRERVYNEMRRHEFPSHVATFGRSRVWLHSDVEAYRDGLPFPIRQPNELRGDYFDVHELAQVLRIQPGSIRHPATATPPITGVVARTTYWLRSDVEEWLRRNPASPFSGRARRAGSNEPATSL